MRSDAVIKFGTTFDVYEGVYEQDPITFELVGTYTFLASDRGLLIPGTAGLVNITSHTQYPLRSVVRNVKDHNGTSVFIANGEEYDMYIVNAAVSLDAFGNVVGWTHQVQPVLPQTRAERTTQLRSA